MIREPHHIAAIGVHHEDVAVVAPVVALPGAIARECDPRPVWRPRRAEVLGSVFASVRQADEAGAVGTYHEDVAPETSPVPHDEGDPGAVRGPARLRCIAQSVREPGRIRTVRLHDEEVGRALWSPIDDSADERDLAVRLGKYPDPTDRRGRVTSGERSDGEPD